jgi:hypothetical protein
VAFPLDAKVRHRCGHCHHSHGSYSYVVPTCKLAIFSWHRHLLPCCSRMLSSAACALALLGVWTVRVVTHASVAMRHATCRWMQNVLELICNSDCMRATCAIFSCIPLCRYQSGARAHEPHCGVSGAQYQFKAAAAPCFKCRGCHENNQRDEILVARGEAWLDTECFECDDIQMVCVS